MNVRHPALPRPLRCALGLLLVLVALNARADVYKWVDAQGHTHYSDLPPDDGSKARVIGSSPAPAARAATPKEDPAAAGNADSAAAKSAGSAAGAPTTKGIKPGTVLNAEDPAATRQRTENCARVRTELGVLQSDSRVFTTDAKGMRQYVDDDSRAARIAELQRQLPAECD